MFISNLFCDFYHFTDDRELDFIEMNGINAISYPQYCLRMH